MVRARWGKWRNVESLGEGGQAHTYIVEAEDEAGRFVLKRLKNVNRLDRFQREVIAGLKLDHPNLVRVVDYDFEPTEGNPWLVMKYYEGGQLKHREETTIDEALVIFKGVCEGVAYAHECGICHRDIKPDNIFLKSDGSPVVGDFGLCFITEEGERFTFSHEAIGPRWYMAPELEDGRLDKISPRSDVYSLGKLLYWLITGRTFSREKHRDDEFDITKGARLSAPFLVYELLDQMIIAEPDSRLANAREVTVATEVLIRRIQMKAHAIGRNIPQSCNYCGLGTYQLVVHPKAEPRSGAYGSDVRNFGFGAVGNAQWVIYVCNHCGNVQTFRTDYAENPEIWS